MKERITYRIRTYLDRYRCIDTQAKIVLYRLWIVGGLLYGYVDRFNVKCISLDDIIARETV